MTASHRGHPMHRIGGVWIYVDNGDPVADTADDRPCGWCFSHNTKEGHDACLGTLPGVMNACCGHGSTGSAYIQWDDGSRCNGQAAIDEQRRLVAEAMK